MKRRAVSRPASINLEREAKIIRREIKLLGQDLKRATNRYVRIGGLLARCKDQLPYGEFMRWTSKNFALSHDTAARWIALAHRFKTDARFRTLRNLPVTVLYALDRQPELIDPILQRHASGETITPKTLKVAVRIERPPPEVVRFVPDYRPPSPLPPSRVPSLPMPRLSPPEPSQPSPESAAPVERGGPSPPRNRAPGTHRRGLGQRYEAPTGHRRPRCGRATARNAPSTIRPWPRCVTSSTRECSCAAADSSRPGPSR